MSESDALLSNDPTPPGSDRTSHPTRYVIDWWEVTVWCSSGPTPIIMAGMSLLDAWMDMDTLQAMMLEASMTCYDPTDPVCASERLKVIVGDGITFLAHGMDRTENHRALSDTATR